MIVKSQEILNLDRGYDTSSSKWTHSNHSHLLLSTIELHVHAPINHIKALVLKIIWWINYLLTYYFYLIWHLELTLLWCFIILDTVVLQWNQTPYPHLKGKIYYKFRFKFTLLYYHFIFKSICIVLPGNKNKIGIRITFFKLESW